MKLLLCSPIPVLDPRLGAARVVLDFAESWRACGWHCDLFPQSGTAYNDLSYRQAVADFIHEHGSAYDVIDFPCGVPPVKLTGGSRPLLVTRVVLLPHHEDFMRDPQPARTGITRLRQWLRARRIRQRTHHNQMIRGWMDANLRDVDLINVGNSRDKECLKRLGIDEDSVVVLPYGLTPTHRARLESLRIDRAWEQRIAFLGTFDFRKGCLDFPEILERVSDAVPRARFRLIGTKGMCPTEEAVRGRFPRSVQWRLEVVPQFNPEDLAGLLDGCSVGMFPSYREGFGIGVVEMLAAALPVAAYDAPGPCDILPASWLSPRGDRSAIATTLIRWLTSEPSIVQQLRTDARDCSQRYDWNHIAAQTRTVYEAAQRRMKHGSEWTGPLAND